ncbi:hypothetical protein WME98_15625 [Sorangium sp. So ce296]|uniref:hypothetical protein n=1 Tax=Sorangium sp. So ce296 TaxID=3133296 RepID=UPI003F61469A
MIGEFEFVAKDHVIRLVPRGDAHLLGDPELLEEALWSLLVQSVAVAMERDPVLITIDAASASRVLITIPRQALRSRRAPRRGARPARALGVSGGAGPRRSAPGGGALRGRLPARARAGADLTGRDVWRPAS